MERTQNITGLQPLPPDRVTWPPTTGEEWEVVHRVIRGVVQKSLQRLPSLAHSPDKLASGSLDSDDIVQEVAVIMFQKRNDTSLHFSHPWAFPNYVAVVADRHITRMVQNQSRERQRLRALWTEVSGLEPAQDVVESAKDFLERMLSHIAGEHEREVFRLRFGEELSNKQIADRLEVSSATVSNRLSRAKAQLMQRFLHGN